MLDMLTIDGRDKVLALGPAFMLPDDKEVAWAGAADHIVKRWDFGWVMGNFLQVDPDGSGASANRNGHVFDLEQVRRRHQMIRYTPVNMLHRDHHNIGTFVATELTDPRTGAPLVDRVGEQLKFPIVEALAGLWKYQCPGEYRAVKDAHAAGHAWFSMEAVPRALTCLTDGCCGGKTYKYEGQRHDTYCDALRRHGSPKRLEDPDFVGGAMVIPPARPGWANADLKQVAGLIESHPEEAERVYEQMAATEGLDGRQLDDLVLVLLAAAFDDEEAALHVNVNWEAMFKRLAINDDLGESAEKSPKDLANYRPADNRDRSCSTCMHFDPTARTCAVVAGDIDPGATSDLWEMANPLMPSGGPMDDADAPGVAIVAVPPTDVREQLAAVGTEPADLIHITLAYLGKDNGSGVDWDDDGDPVSKDRVIGALAAFCAGAPEVDNVHLGGLGRFDLGDGQEATIALVDAPGLVELRVRMVAALAAAGVEIDTTHGYTPHVTLGYHQAGKSPTSDIPQVPDFEVDALELWWGDNDRTRYELGAGEIDFGGDDDDTEEQAKLALLVNMQDTIMPTGEREKQLRAECRANAVTMAAAMGRADLIPADWPEREQLYDRDVSAEKRQELAKKRWALPDGSFPVETKEDWYNARQALGRTDAKKRGQVIALLKRRASALGIPKDDVQQLGER